jgi:GAF domain-containing protein
VADQDLTAALQALRLAARRSAVARRLESDAEQALLQAIVESTATLFEAEAASIALFERDPDRLEFRVAAGAQGAGAIGMSVPPDRGIVGYVFSTGQPLALSDVGTDPRFDRSAAERTGYIPRSIAAVPLVADEQTVGVLQVLDKHSSPTFSLRDMELLAVFAAQAAAAIRASRVQRDTGRLLRAVLGGLADELDEAGLDALVAAATADLDAAADEPFWRLVDRVARLRGMGEAELRLVADILEVVASHSLAERRGR